jgi:regulator of protease activity HflC (stomatin/prohibitin superfamily)
MIINPATILLIIIVVFILLIIIKSIKIVPQKQAFIVERLGKYRATLEAGFHILTPFIDRVSYKHTLKEQAVDVPPQTCITKDNISVEVDGILYMQVIDPAKASYGIGNYAFASIQLSQTTMRSVMGKLSLDKTFEERNVINSAIVEAVDKASDPWGVKVARYEVKNISPPQSIKDAMEKQMRAEREKRATIAESEGQRQAAINCAEGERQALIAKSEGVKQQKINIADGDAYEVFKVAEATAKSLKLIANAIEEKSGKDAVGMKLGQQYITEFGKLAKENNTLIIPSDLANIAGFVKTAKSVLENTTPNGK